MGEIERGGFFVRICLHEGVTIRGHESIDGNWTTTLPAHHLCCILVSSIPQLSAATAVGQW
jgi:hypothetical protein